FINDDQLTFTPPIASVSRSCRFALYNIRKIRPYLTQYATQLLVQTLVSSQLDYCNALLPACMAKPLQMIQNAAAIGHWPMSHWLNTAIKCANTLLLNCRHTKQV